jgi:phosphatidylglycerophosphate synthase
VIIDAFDGSLARLQKKDGDAGSMVDMLCDHTGIIIVVGGLIYTGLLNQTLGYVYSYIYTILIIFIILRNIIKRPIRVVFRTKY